MMRCYCHLNIVYDEWRYGFVKIMDIPESLLQRDVAFMLHLEIPTLYIHEISYCLIERLNRDVMIVFEDHVCSKENYNEQHVAQLRDDLMYNHGWDMF